MKSLRVPFFLSFIFSASCLHTGTLRWTKALPNIFEDAKESIFEVTIPVAKEKNSMGNAFMIEHGVLATASHICDDDIGSLVFINKDKKVYGAMIAYKEEEADICFLESAVPGRPLTVLAEADNYDRAYAIGYVAHGIGPPQLKIFIRELRVRGELPYMCDNPPDGIGKVLSLDGQILKGDSGSPLFNEDGYVIGLITGVMASSKEERVGNGIAFAADARTFYAARQHYWEAKKERLPVPLPLPLPPSTNVVKFPGEKK